MDWMAAYDESYFEEGKIREYWESGLALEKWFDPAFEDYREEFKESFPELEEAKYFIRKPKAMEDLVRHVATILG